jgi:CheY-like chemotaxis protein
MDAETLTHLFEPFYTTKLEGKGTGLGLPTVYGIVKQSGGSILVQSKPNAGTTFRIYLPRTEKTPKIIGVRETSIESGRETILVVEDNMTVRQLTNEILALCGYRVLSAGSAEEALRICKDFQEPVDLLLTDVIMPNQSGPTLAERLTKLRPGIKVLYMSGYTEQMIGQQGLSEGSVALLEKPFTVRELASKVREVLNKNSKSTEVRNRTNHA